MLSKLVSRYVPIGLSCLALIFSLGACDQALRARSYTFIHSWLNNPPALNLYQPGYKTASNEVEAPDVVKAELIRVIDGDTLVARLEDGREEKVRLLGVDTPETVHPNLPVQCYGPEASKFLKEYLPPGTTIFLATETGNKYDHFGRMIAYVLVVQKTVDHQNQIIRYNVEMVNLRLIYEGYARAYTRYPFLLQEEFVETEREAREARRGLWSACPEA
jgi:micrococcal nuclease